MNMRLTMRSVGIAAGLLILATLAAWQNRRLTDARRAGLPEAPAYASQVPPLLNFLTVGLGGFRGIAAEILWSHADRMQDEGRYIELVQLSDWITWLDPHATEAWTYNAWNMAYNLSIMMHRPEDRLRWVLNGIALLRDQGLPANPHSASLYRELAWLYEHKIGSDDDSAHTIYRLALANAVAPLLNPDGSVDDTPAHRQALAAIGLSVERMLQLEHRFGPLDWRLAMSHAIYWATQGLEHAHGEEDLAGRRAVYQPLILSLTAGRFDGDLSKSVYHASPNPALFASTLSFMKETADKHPSPNIRAIYCLLLVQAIRHAHELGQTTLEQDYYEQLKHAGKGALAVPPLSDLLRNPKLPIK